MPTEQHPPSDSSPARKGSSENGQNPPITGRVRGLLGLPMRESGVLSAEILTAPPRGHHYGSSPFPASEENDESLRELALNEGSMEQGGNAGADAASALPRSLRRDDASLAGAIAENAADALSTTTKMPAGERGQTNFIIPGVSTQRTPFAALSHNPDTSKVTQQEESQETSPDKLAPQHTPVSLPHTRAMAMFDVESLSRLGHLVTDGAREQPSAAVRHPSAAPRSPNPMEQMGAPNRERGGQELIERFEHLQRTVRDLAATVSAQAKRISDDGQAQRHERTVAAPQRAVIIKPADAPSSTPRAFWERSRLGRFYLRTGR